MTDILTTVRIMLGISDMSQDDLLSTIIDTVTEKVLAYCKLSTLPDRLQYTVAEMAIKAYKAMSDGQVSSVKRGDVTINFSVKAVSDIMEDYIKVLNAFRRARPNLGG